MNSYLEQLRLSSVEREFRKRIAGSKQLEGEYSGSVSTFSISYAPSKLVNFLNSMYYFLAHFVNNFQIIWVRKLLMMIKLIDN